MQRKAYPLDHCAAVPDGSLCEYQGMAYAALKQLMLQALLLRLRTAVSMQRKKYPVDLYATVQQYLSNLGYVDTRSMPLTQLTCQASAPHSAKLTCAVFTQRKQYPVDLYATVQQYLTHLMDTF